MDGVVSVGVRNGKVVIHKQAAKYKIKEQEDFSSNMITFNMGIFFVHLTIGTQRKSSKNEKKKADIENHLTNLVSIFTRSFI
nr:MAG: hypothetical protein DIU66_10530 [Bacillota bacterium]